MAMTAVVVFGAVAPMGIAGAAEGAPQAKQVLLLHAFGLSRAFRSAFDSGFLEALGANGAPLDVHVESMDVERRWPDQQPQALLQYLTDKYATRRIDVLVAVGDTALPLARELAARLGDRPIVACVFAGGAVLAGDDRLTGIDATVAFRETVELALALRPGTRRVFIVDGTPRNPGDVEAELKRQMRDLAVEMVYLRDLSLGDVVARLAAAPPDSAVLFVRQRLLDATHDIDGQEGLVRVVAASALPVFTINETHFGRGVIGGVVWRFDELGRQAAAMTQRLAAGADVRRTPPETIVRRATVDWTQLQRWNLPEQRLPTDAVVLYRPKSAFEQHRLQFAIGGAVLTALLALVVGLLIERTWRRRAERDTQHLRNDLAHLSRLSAMGELTAALAHELSQPLTGILSNAQAAARLLAQGKVTTSELHEILGDIVADDKRAVDVIARVRELVKKHTTERSRVDLNDVVRDVTRLVATNSVIREVSIAVVAASEPLEVDADRVQLQQVVLNLLLNAIEAAATSDGGPHRVTVDTTASNRQAAHVIVRDNGPGLQQGTETQVFAPFYTTKESGMGMGLSIARSIVEAHGGRIWAANGRERGAEFHVTLPRLSAVSR